MEEEEVVRVLLVEDHAIFRQLFASVFDGEPDFEVVELLRVADRERTRGREARKAFEQLTDRERDVLFALAEGLNDKEIAGRLRVRPGTARSYVASMLGKLGAHSRLQALVFAARHGFVQIGPADDPP